MSNGEGVSRSPLAPMGTVLSWSSCLSAMWGPGLLAAPHGPLQLAVELLLAEEVMKVTS